MKLKEGQVWYNYNTEEIYISAISCNWEHEVCTMTSWMGSFCVSQSFIDNPINNWHYIGEL